jgi:hypothetical protein
VQRDAFPSVKPALSQCNMYSTYIAHETVICHNPQFYRRQKKKLDRSSIANTEACDVVTEI